MNEDKGRGNPERWPAEELEKLYRLGEKLNTLRIRGDALNLALRVTKYEPTTWYKVTDEGVEKL